MVAESRVCPDCGTEKKADKFYRAPERKDGLRAYCIECVHKRKTKRDNPSVYKITNLLDGKIYIGQSWDTKKRWADHRDQVNLDSPQYIHRAIRKHGLDNFYFEVLVQTCCQYCMDQLEEYFICLYNSHTPSSGYNQKSGGSAGRHSEESRKKMSESQLKRAASPDYVHPMQGKKQSEKAKQAVSDRWKGVPRPDISIIQKQVHARKKLEEQFAQQSTISTRSPTLASDEVCAAF